MCPLDTNISPSTKGKELLPVPTETVTTRVPVAGWHHHSSPWKLGPTEPPISTYLYNLSYKNADIPVIGEVAEVIALLKPGKPASEGPAYWPIFLLCPVSKLLVRLLLPEWNTLSLVQWQHRFHKQHSTTTALFTFTQQISRRFNQPLLPNRTVKMSIDFSKAFFSVRCPNYFMRRRLHKLFLFFQYLYNSRITLHTHEACRYWSYERSLAISALKPNILLFILDFRQSHSHFTVHLSNSPPSLRKTIRFSVFN